MIYLDELRACNNLSSPVDIPTLKNKSFKVQTKSYKDLWIQAENVSGNLILGNIISTPPSDKEYSKGDQMIVDVDHIVGASVRTNDVR
jgi:hypothetical protein